MGVFDKVESPKVVVPSGPVKVSYYNKKTGQYELVAKGSKTEKLLIKSGSWELKKAPTK